MTPPVSSSRWLSTCCFSNYLHNPHKKNKRSVKRGSFTSPTLPVWEEKFISKVSGRHLWIEFELKCERTKLPSWWVMKKSSVSEMKVTSGHLIRLSVFSHRFDQGLKIQFLWLHILFLADCFGPFWLSVSSFNTKPFLLLSCCVFHTNRPMNTISSQLSLQIKVQEVQEWRSWAQSKKRLLRAALKNHRIRPPRRSCKQLLLPKRATWFLL